MSVSFQYHFRIFSVSEFFRVNAIMELYKLYYKLAKDYFITDKQVDEETEDFLSSL